MPEQEIAPHATTPRSFPSSSESWVGAAPLLKESRTWVWIAIAWVILAVGSWLLEYGLSFGSPNGPMTLGRAAARLVYAIPWYGVTIFAAWMSDTFTIRSPRQYAAIALQLLAGGVVALGWALLAYYLSVALIPGWQPMGAGTMVKTTFMTTYFIYLSLVVVMHALNYGREYRARQIATLEQARAAVQAQLNLLKMELQPHFLFNTLQAISALMHRDVKAANEMLVLLADMLESALRTRRDQEVTLRDELESLKPYIQIQRIRFGSRLKVEYAVEPETLIARVPHMMLQPLVENAIKHGIERQAAGGRLEISAKLVSRDLELAVQDDGPGLKGRPVFGLGLTNTQERLGYLYGDRHRFELAEAPGGGARASIRVPLTQAEPS